MHELADIAASAFGCAPQAELPVSDSFGSEVVRFLDRDGCQYVVKRPSSKAKASKEARALTRLAGHPRVPRLLGFHEQGEHAYLWLEGLDAKPWTDVQGATQAFVADVGRAVRAIHAQSEESFAGASTWHALLVRNALRYRDLVLGTHAGEEDLVDAAVDLLRRQLSHVPDSCEAVLVHFDLRPGNVLVRDGELVGIIDFEASRGGHASMDLFKLWQQVWTPRPATREWFLAGYTEESGAVDWLQSVQLEDLMQVYALYHGLAGLAWCAQRQQLRSAFATSNRELVRAAGSYWASSPRSRRRR